MKRALALLGLLCFVAPALAASSTSANVAGGPSSTATLTAGGTVLLLGGDGYPGLSLNFSARVAAPLYVGIETGIGYRNTNALTPILATAELRPRAGRLAPFLGAGVGFMALWGNDRSNWRLAVLLKPGVEVQLAETLALRLEPRLGFFGRDFTFAPVLAGTFSL